MGTPYTVVKVERYPAFKEGKIVSWNVDSAEFTAINSKKYMWISKEEGVLINEFLKKSYPLLKIGNHVINFVRLFEDIPWPYISIAWDLERYIEWLKRELPKNLKVVLNFSGGKDSIAAAKVLSEVADEVVLIYSHVSYLETPKNIDFVEKAANKLGLKVIILEADKEIMRNMLKKGMPFRGNRWCTFMKVRPIKKVLKELSNYVRADGERMTEALKRFKRLGLSSKRPRPFDGGRVRPIYPMTLIDVVKIVRDLGLVHEDYLKGLPRVACTFCPYKSLREFDGSEWREIEDPGLIEEAIRASYKRFEYDIPWEDFIERHLWRFSPKLANVIYKMQEILRRREDLERTTSDYVNELYKSLWTEDIPRPKVVSVEEGYERIMKVLRATLERATHEFELANSMENSMGPNL